MRTSAVFGDELRLRGYTVEPFEGGLRAGEPLPLTLFWEPLRSLAGSDYVVFVHLTRPDDPTPLVQIDGQPIEGGLPTGLWTEPLAQIHDERTLLLREMRQAAARAGPLCAAPGCGTGARMGRAWPQAIPMRRCLTMRSCLARSRCFRRWGPPVDDRVPFDAHGAGRSARSGDPAGRARAAAGGLVDAAVPRLRSATKPSTGTPRPGWRAARDLRFSTAGSGRDRRCICCFWPRISSCSA